MDDERIRAAVQIAYDDGMVDGSHHKQWVIDQMLRALLGEDYAQWVAEYNADEEYEDWSAGIAP